MFVYDRIKLFYRIFKWICTFNNNTDFENNDVNKKDEKMNFEQHVEVNYDSLTMSEKEMLQFIVQHKELIVSKTIVEVGELLLTSKSTVLRLAKKIGFRGFTDMRYSIQDSISKTKSVDKIDLLSQLQMDIQKTFRFATELDFLPILKKIYEASQVILYATGFTQNNFTKELSNELFLSHRPNYLVSGETNFSMLADNLNKDDLVIITSLSGNTKGIQTTINKLNAKGVTIIGVTEFSDNFLKNNSTYQLFYEISRIDENPDLDSRSMSCLYIVLMILARKYREFVNKLGE